MQTGFYFDQSRCIGCYTCVAACRSWNRLPETAPDIIRITSKEEGDFPNVSLKHLFYTCFHCAEPACAGACPEGLIQKRTEDGIVVVSEPERCNACEACVAACPYEAPRMSTAGDSIVKCGMCLDRLKEGKQPVCVAACPVEALEAGPMDELIAKHGSTRAVKDFPEPTLTKPSVIFRV